PAAPVEKWGTLIRAPRPVTGPIAAPQPAGGMDALPQPRLPFVRPSSGPVTAAVPSPMQGSLAAEASAQAQRARAPSGPLQQQRQPAVRAPSGPIAQRHPAARAQSGPIAQPRHPAMRAPSGPIAGAVALPGAKPRAPSGPMVLNLPPSAAGDPANANHLDTGLLELDDQFSTPLHDGPSLEVASLNPGPRREPPQQQAQARRDPARRESPRPQRGQAEAPRDPGTLAEQRAKRVRDLARYPAAPPKIMGAIPYFLRVYARRRELESQVVQLTQQRKRLELASDDALCLLGQALYVKRSDPQLKQLAAQVRVVGETAQDVGARAAAAKRTETELHHEHATLERELQDSKATAEPVQAREAAVSQAVDEHKQQIKRREMLIRKAEAEQKALRATNDPASLVKVSALAAEREQHQHEIQVLQQKLPPVEQELLELRATLDEHTAQIEGLQERQRKHQNQMGREHGRERVAVGGSQSAYRDALRSLANAATKLDLAALAPAEQKEAVETHKHASASRESEELMRAAIACYDAHAYQRGMQLLVGSTIGVFVLFLALIVF
ncbi:MAG TPA: hypothetical protein VFG30_44770, partial [Polyangiales bacterium]|nr:hypothetical protein [Polyangiales bacterium]